MAELINLRTARKQAKRRQDDTLANARRMDSGQPKHMHELQIAQRKKAARDLDQRRIEPGDQQ